MRKLLLLALFVLLTSIAANAQQPRVIVTTSTGDITATGSSLNVNCTGGCAAPSDNTTASTALAALNNVITVSLAGERGAAFQLQSAGTLVATITPQCSFDGGTIYNANGYIQDPFTGALSTTATIASAQATTDYPVMCPQGASHAQMKVTAFTSGTANFLARSTVVTWPNIGWGVVTTGAPTYTTGQISPVSLTTAGGLRIDGSGVTQPVSGTVTANQGGTWTVQPGNTPNTTAWLVDVSDRAARLVGQVEGRAASGAAKAGNPNQIGGVFNTTQPTVTTGQAVEAQATARGGLIVATGVDAFAVNASQTGTWTVQPGNTANTTPWLLTPIPSAASAAASTVFYNQALTTAQTVKASAGNIYGWNIYNASTGLCFVQVFNTTTPTLGTTVPIFSIPLTNGLPNAVPPGGVALNNFSTAIAVASTTTAQGGTVCPTATIVNLWYQ